MRCLESILEAKLMSFEDTRWCVKNGNKRGRTWKREKEEKWRKVNAAWQVEWWCTILDNALFLGWLFCKREKGKTSENWPKKKEKRREKNMERGGGVGKEMLTLYGYLHLLITKISPCQAGNILFTMVSSSKRRTLFIP